MGDHASRKKGSADAPAVGSAGLESFWVGVAQGATRSLVDPRVPGTQADPSAMLPWVDADHELSPTEMATKVTAHLDRSTEQAKAYTRSKAQAHVDTLVAAMDDTDQREGRWKFLNTLDRIDTPGLREAVLARFQLQTGRPLSDVIATSDWHGSRDAAQAHALISPERAATEKRIAALSPSQRAKLEREASKTASEIADVVGRSDASARVHKLEAALAGKSPEQIEAIRAAVRTQTRGNESLYEQIDRSLSKPSPRSRATRCTRRRSH